MGKTIVPMAAPRSASDLVKLEARPVHAAGGVMRIDDIPDDRSARVEERFADAVTTQMTPTAPPVIAQQKKLEHVVIQDTPPIPKPAARRTEQISSPIDVGLRRKVRDLRSDYRVSEAFVLEYALRRLFADRDLADIASELKANGGALRRG